MAYDAIPAFVGALHKREAVLMQAWADFCRHSAKTGTNVQPIRVAKVNR
ncbi:hypothetical protein [Novosphingobium sp. Rr 2-17]|nr:hypothetical protein [Novosphingobium sp. Rr 2-17]